MLTQYLWLIGLGAYEVDECGMGICCPRSLPFDLDFEVTKLFRPAGRDWFVAVVKMIAWVERMVDL